MNANLQRQMESYILEKRQMEAQLSEKSARIKNLQQELDNSVAVQTDFVRLSQSLQMELEKIRQSEKEVSSAVFFLEIKGQTVAPRRQSKTPLLQINKQAAL